MRVYACVATRQAGAREEANAKAGEALDHRTDAKERGTAEGIGRTQRGRQRTTTHPRYQRSDTLCSIYRVRQKKVAP